MGEVKKLEGYPEYMHADASDYDTPKEEAVKEETPAAEEEE